MPYNDGISRVVGMYSILGAGFMDKSPNRAESVAVVFGYRFPISLVYGCTLRSLCRYPMNPTDIF